MKRNRTRNAAKNDTNWAWLDGIPYTVVTTFLPGTANNNKSQLTYQSKSASKLETWRLLSDVSCIRCF